MANGIKKSEEVIAEIERRMSIGETLRAICRDEHMPNWTSVYDWIRDDKEIALRLERARVLGFDAIAEQCFDIADDASNDYVEKQTRNGTVTVLDTEHVQRSKLRIETRLKLLACWHPKQYGAKQSIEVTDTNVAEAIAAARKRVLGE